MNSVLVSGIGIVSSLGCTLAEVAEALRHGRSGLKHVPELHDAGLANAVYAPVRNLPDDVIDARPRRTMSANAYYAAVATKSALADAGLADGIDPIRRVAIIGSEMGGVSDLVTMRRLLHTGKKSRSGATGVTKVMDSTATGNLASILGLHGRSNGISAGMSTGLAAIRQGAELIQRGVADLAVCGAAEEDCWRQLGPALERSGESPANFEELPERSCRPFDADRQGTVLSAGAGIVILESADHAKKRQARPIAEVVGCGSGSDGCDSPSSNGTGLRRAIEMARTQAARQGAVQIDSIHSGAKGTRQADAVEAAVLRDAFGDAVPVSATTGLTGFALGASSAIRAVLTLLMLRENFLAPTTNLDVIAPECAGLLHVRQPLDVSLQTALCTAASFGCFNECLFLRRFES